MSVKTKYIAGFSLIILTIFGLLTYIVLWDSREFHWDIKLLDGGLAKIEGSYSNILSVQLAHSVILGGR